MNLCFGYIVKYEITNCLKKGLKILAVPVAIAQLHDDRPSTWFQGYNEKFFLDKGVFFARLYGSRAWMIALYHCLKHGKGRYKDWGWKRAWRKMCEGTRSVK